MILSLSGQALIFLQTVCIGLCAGLLYEIFRILRLYIHHTNIVIHTQDLLYWLFIAGGMFYIFLNQHYGEIRGFCFLGVAIGMTFYFALFSRLVQRSACFVINLILKAVKRILSILAIPIKALYRLVERPLNLFKIFIKNVLQNIKNYVRMKLRLLKRDLTVILKKI